MNYSRPKVNLQLTYSKAGWTSQGSVASLQIKLTEEYVDERILAWMFTFYWTTLCKVVKLYVYARVVKLLRCIRSTECWVLKCSADEGQRSRPRPRPLHTSSPGQQKNRNKHHRMHQGGSGSSSSNSSSQRRHQRRSRHHHHGDSDVIDDDLADVGQ